MCSCESRKHPIPYEFNGHRENCEMSYESIDKIQNLLASTIYSHTSDRKKAAGRAPAILRLAVILDG